MANSLLTPDIIANEMLMQLENEMVLGGMVHTDYSREFGAVGSTISIDKPMRYKGQDDNLDISAYTEDVIQGKQAVTLNKTKTVSIEVSAKEMTLDIRDLSEKVLQPALIPMKERVEAQIAAQYKNFYHFTGTPGTTPSTFKELAQAAAVLTDSAVPSKWRYSVHPPDTAVELADSLKNVNVEGKVKTALEEAKVGRYGQLDNYTSVHMPFHTVGDYGGTPLVNGGSQGTTYLASKDSFSSTLVTDGWSTSKTGLLKAGDVFTIADVYAVNPGTLASTGRLQTFTVLTDANSDGSGNSTITVSPAIIADGTAFATVDSVPADNAAITVKTGAANSSHRQSMVFHKNAIALVTRPLNIPTNAGFKTTSKTGNRVSISCSEGGDFNTLAHKFRFDMLFDVVTIDPRLGLRMTA